MILLLLVLTVMQGVQTRIQIKVKDGDFGLWVYTQNGFYRIYTSMNGNFCDYSYPIEPMAHITYEYDGNYTINNHSVNILNRKGLVSAPPLIQNMFRGSSTINSREALQVCYDFTTERLSLKIVVGILGLVTLLLAGHGSTKCSSIGRDLLRSEFTGRFSWSRSPMARGQTTHSHIEEGAGIGLSEVPETLYQTSTV